MKSAAAFVGLAATATLSSVVLARQELQVSHEPIARLFTADGTPAHPHFLASRWETSELPLNFRKRDLSGVGSKRSDKACRADHSQNNGGLLDTLDHLGQKVSSWIEGGRFHDHALGIVINKATDNSADNEWLVDVGFGTRAQTLKMVFDSGSSDTWVYSPACCYANNHTYFDPARSSTYHNRTLVNGTPQAAAAAGTPGQPWSASYGSGSSAAGYVGIDDFTFGLQRLKVDQLPVALTTNISGGSRASRGMEGIVGLSAGSGSNTAGGWTSPFEAMSSRGLINETYLTATLRKANRNTGKGGGGRYTFGEIDDEHLEGNVTWTRALSPYLWAGYFDQMTMGDQVLAIAPGTDERPRRFMIDTGSAVFYLPPSIVKQINSQIAGSYVADASSGLAFPYLVPCDTGLKRYERTAKNPEFNLQIGGTNFTIPKEDYVFYANEPIPASTVGGRQGLCYSAFQTGPAQISIVGLSFIKNHVVVLDQGGRNLTVSARRIGLGRRSDVRYE
ncbi:related to pepsinogen precursor [Sporisorium reilianum SRZ2]|uniref:Related to pepsinogen n=1 Tax=Sporisorium reilianum (strain SRZ2) TaxID=999809 RepID=E6ZML6_SPORE|nr:related to pepsinogen precursor [Sporisorium reilianum SRZ2]